MLVCVCSVGVCSYIYLCMGVGVYLRTWARFCVCVSTFDCFECIYIYTGDDLGLEVCAGGCLRVT